MNATEPRSAFYRLWLRGLDDDIAEAAQAAASQDTQALRERADDRHARLVRQRRRVARMAREHDAREAEMRAGLGR